MSEALTKPGGTNGDEDYCDNASNKCVSGEGDCDLDSQCTGTGIVCINDVGPRYNQPFGNDVCAPSHCTNGVKEGSETAVDCGGPCGRCPDACVDRPGGAQYINGGNNFCRGCYCDAGQGDCDSTYECAPGLVCAANFGTRFGFSDVTDVCVVPHCYNDVQDGDEAGIDCGGADCGTCSLPCLPGPPVNGHANYCSACQCTAGQGDCDADRECAAGVECLGNQGARFGWTAATDVCLASHCGNNYQDADETGIDCGGECGPCLPFCTGTPGGTEFCINCRCTAGQGDCDTNRECAPDLYCATNAAAAYGFPTGTDVCIPKTCTSAANCPPEHYCSQSGECRSNKSPCTLANQCASGQTCRNGECDCATCGPGCTCGVGGTCDANEDCDADLRCVGGACQDCPNGYDAFGLCIPTTPCVGDAACPTTNPECNPGTCPSGMTCPEVENGWRYGQPGKFICEPSDCCSTPEEAGTTTPECGACPVCDEDCSGVQCGDSDVFNGCGRRCPGICGPGDSGCQQSSDCTTGHICRSGMCVPTEICGRPNLAPPDCGPGSICGACPPTPVPSCAERSCGLDPNTGANCGSCGGSTFCNAGGQCVALNNSPPIQVPRDDGTLRPVVPPVAPTPPSLFGSTSGAFAVTDRGSASYTIPIELPPGRAGIMPSLAVRYTSSTANGALGVGWSLDGFSSIARCARTYAQDGFTRAIQGDASDAFCMDGQRLVPDATMPDVYRTAIESFSKIVAVGTTTSGPASFRVHTKDGRTLTYGGTADSRSFLSGSVVGTWHLNREMDRSGNFLRIAYEQTSAVNASTGATSTSELVPQSIMYTGIRTGVSDNIEYVDGDREVIFNYVQERSDLLSGNRSGGSAFARIRLLKNIDVRAKNQRVRLYTFQHETSPNGATRLTSLQECSGPAAQSCRKPTVFSYFDEGGFEPPVTKIIPLETGRSLSPQILPYGIVLKSSEGRDVLDTLMLHSTPHVVSPIPGGVSMAVSVVPLIGPYAATTLNIANRLGSEERSRLIYESFRLDMVSSTHLSGRWSCRDGTLQQQIAPVRQVVGNGPFGAEKVVDTCPIGLAFRRRWFIDLNGDGLEDTLYCAADAPDRFTGSLDYKLARADSNYYHRPSTESDHPDWHADRDGEFPVFGNVCAQYERQPFTIGFDVDGDGATNLVVMDPVWGWAALMKTGTTGALSFEWRTDRTAGITFDANLHYFTIPIDANGDGLRDLLGMPMPSAFGSEFQGSNIPTTPRIAYNTGLGFQEQPLTPSLDGVEGEGGTFPDWGSFAADIDQDGIEELVFPSQAARGSAAPWRVARIRDGRFINAAIPSLVGGAGSIGDFDGDGDLDAFTQAVPVGGNRQPYLLHHGVGRRQNLLARVTDGLGHQVVVEYNATNSTGADVYDKWPGVEGGSCLWPQRCASRVDHPLVSDHLELHFKNQARTTPVVDRVSSYTYKGARYDVAGYGWLGFSERSTTVTDGVGGFIGSTSTTFEPPEAWTDEISTVPYLYLKAGLPKSQVEEYPDVDSDISLSSDHGLSVTRTFEWTQRTSAFGRPFTFMSRTQVDTYERMWDLGWARGVMQEVGTTDVDPFGSPIDEKTQRQEYKTEFGLESLDPTSLTVDQVLTTYFVPTQTDIDIWRFALAKSKTEISDPRCEFPTGCPDRRRSRTSSFTYYSGTNLLHTVTRAPDDPVLEVETVLTRDNRGNVTGVVVTDAAGDVRASSATFGPDQLFPETINSLGDGKTHTTQVRFDTRFGTLEARADPNGIDETWSYDVNGVNGRHDGPSGTITAQYSASDYQLAANGFDLPANSAVVTSKLGGETTTQLFDSFGKVLSRSTTGFQGTPVLEEFAYDVRQRLTRQSRPHEAGSTSQGEISFTYDNLDRLLSVHYPDETHTDYAYALATSLDTDEAGPRVPGAHFYKRTTDQRQKPTIQALDRDGQPVAATDALGHTTTYRYGAFGHLQAITDPVGRSIGFVHDPYGQVISVTDAARGGTELRAYNGFGQITSSFDAAGRSRELHYDGFGRIETLVDDDGTTSWIYDGSGPNEIGRLVETTSSFGQREIYGYEPRGYARNRGFPVQKKAELSAVESPAADPVELVTQYHYDDYARLEQIDYPSSGGAAVAVKYAFDNYGHTVKAFNPANSAQNYWELVTADQGHRIKVERLGTHACGAAQGTTTTRTYHDSTGLPHTIKTQCGSTILQDLTYTYDDAGNLKSRKTASLVENFGHDDLNRLTHMSAGTGVPLAERYIYDPDGRGRMFNQADVGEYSYYPQGRDWIHHAGAYTYGHDAVGNITSRSGPDVPGTTQEIEYTSFDLPSRITSSAEEVDFAYDSSGSRVVKQNDAATTFYAGGGAYQRSESATSTNHRFMIYAGGRAVAQLSTTQQGGTTPAPTVKYMHDDMLGSVNVVSSSAGAVTSTRSYSPFGKNVTPDAETPYGFTGHEGDDDLGLVNMQGRMYDPTIGQFLSADPLLQQPYGQGLNRFAYVNNSPLNFTDPSGFACRDRSGRGCSAEIGPIGAIAGAIGVAGGAVAMAHLSAGPNGGAGTGAGAAAASDPAAISNPSAGQPGVGSGNFASAADSIWGDADLHAPKPTEHKPGETPRSSAGRAGGATGWGAVPSDGNAASPVVERPPLHPSVDKVLKTLHPEAAQRMRDFIQDVEDELGFRVTISGGYASYDDQMAKWEVGRDPRTGRRYQLDEVKMLPNGRQRWKQGYATTRTQARPGTSYHQFGVAIDVTVTDASGKMLSWSKADTASFKKWGQVGDIAHRHGLEWGGSDIGWWDPVHFQYTNGVSVSEMAKRYRAGVDVLSGGASQWRAPWGHPLGPVKK